MRVSLFLEEWHCIHARAKQSALPRESCTSSKNAREEAGTCLLKRHVYIHELHRLHAPLSIHSEGMASLDACTHESSRGFSVTPLGKGG